MLPASLVVLRRYWRSSQSISFFSRSFRPFMISRQDHSRFKAPWTLRRVHNFLYQLQIRVVSCFNEHIPRLKTEKLVIKLPLLFPSVTSLCFFRNGCCLLVWNESKLDTWIVYRRSCVCLIQHRGSDVTLLIQWTLRKTAPGVKACPSIHVPRHSLFEDNKMRLARLIG